eukprot:8626758-Pyramimonas_sp.AAC.1
MCSHQQLGIIARLLRCIEQRGQFPSALQEAVTCLIPKHKPGAVKFRGFVRALLALGKDRIGFVAYDTRRAHPFSSSCSCKTSGLNRLACLRRRFTRRL